MSDANKMPFIPEVPERNSEGTVTKVMGIVALVVVGLGGGVSALSDAGLQEMLPWWGGVVGVFGFVSKLAWEYIRSRPLKHQAMASKMVAETQALMARNGALEKPEGQGGATP
jgi:hypothetical protein